MKKRVNVVLYALVVGLLVSGCTSQAPGIDETPSETVEIQTETSVAPIKVGKEIDADDLLLNEHARRALALAIDRQTITHNLYGETANAVHYFIPQGFVYDADNKDFRSTYPEGWYAYDPDLAKVEWGKAKIQLDFDFVKMDLLTSDRDLGEQIEAYWESHLHGLDVILQTFDVYEKQRIGDFDVHIMGWVPDYPDPLTFLEIFTTTAQHNYTGYSSNFYDRNIQAARSSSLTEGERMDLLRDLERFLVEEEIQVIPLFQDKVMALTSPIISGIEYHSFAGEMRYKYAKTARMFNGKHILNVTGTSDVRTLDTAKMTSSSSVDLISNVVEGLVSLTTAEKIEHGIAESWKISDGGKRYTFTLRPDAYWSDGSEITAHDFEYAWKRIANPETGSPAVYMIENAQIKNYEGVIKGDLPLDDLGVKALDDITLQVDLEADLPYFLKLISMPNFAPVKQAYVEDQGANYAKDFKHILYSGPFILVQHDPDYGYMLEKSRLYWDADEVYLDGVTVRDIRNREDAHALYKAGKLDILPLNNDDLKKYGAHDHLTERVTPLVFFMQFNVGKH